MRWTSPSSTGSGRSRCSRPWRCRPGCAICCWRSRARRKKPWKCRSFGSWPGGWPRRAGRLRCWRKPGCATRWSRRSSRTATAGCRSSGSCCARGSCAMAELAELIAQAAGGKGLPVYLFEGDEYLARTSARELAEALVPEKDRALNLVLLDASAGAREIVSHLVTIAMFAAPKAVVVEGADAFAEEIDAERELVRARELWQGKRQRDAARRLLKLVRGAGWGAAEVAFGSKTGMSAAKWRKEVGASPQDDDKGWLQELSAWALGQKISAPPEDLEVLLKAVERGLPPRTHLVLVAETLPPKHALVRLAAEKGAHVKRRAERRGRGIGTLDISTIVAEVL